MVIEIWGEKKKLSDISYCNPCKRLELNKLEEIEGQDKNNIVWGGDFNARNTLWGSERMDNNGQVVEELLEEKTYCAK